MALPSKFVRILFVGVGAGLLLGDGAGLDDIAFSQTTRSKPAGEKRVTTIINIELTTGDEGAGLLAQRWGAIFEKLDVTLTIRRARPDDKLGVTEKKSGTSVRQVNVLGKLDRSGKLILADRTYSDKDVSKITDWLNDLREFGALGSPNGQPAWGLTKQQFGVIHAALSKPLKREVQEELLTKALGLFELPPEHPLKFSAQAEKFVRDQDKPLIATQSLAGISQGTALAALLNEHGLGYRPRRLPGGEIELGIYLLSDTTDVWPVGWPLEKPGPQTAPKLYAYTMVDLEEIELDAVLESAASVTGIPIVLDKHGLAAKEIDLSQVKVSHPMKRTTWSLALQTLTFKAKTKFEVLIDEAGKPFLWVTPLGTPRRPAKEEKTP